MTACYIIHTCPRLCLMSPTPDLGVERAPLVFKFKPQPIASTNTQVQTPGFSSDGCRHVHRIRDRSVTSGHPNSICTCTRLIFHGMPPEPIPCIKAAIMMLQPRSNAETSTYCSTVHSPLRFGDLRKSWQPGAQARKSVETQSTHWLPTSDTDTTTTSMAPKRGLDVPYDCNHQPRIPDRLVIGCLQLPDNRVIRLIADVRQTWTCPVHLINSQETLTCSIVRHHSWPTLLT